MPTPAWFQHAHAHTCMHRQASKCTPSNNATQTSLAGQPLVKTNTETHTDCDNSKTMPSNPPTHRLHCYANTTTSSLSLSGTMAKLCHAFKLPPPTCHLLLTVRGVETPPTLLTRGRGQASVVNICKQTNPVRGM